MVQTIPKQINHSTNLYHFVLNNGDTATEQIGYEENTILAIKASHNLFCEGHN